MQALNVLTAVAILPQHTGKETTAIVLRWVHLTAGIAWIGLLYFFNLVHTPFMKQVDAETRPKVLRHLTLPALNWFRWSALLTVFAGFWYWSEIYVAADAHLAGKNPWGAIGLWLLIWVVAWHVFFAVAKRVQSLGLLVAITAILVSVAAWLFVNYTPVGGDDNHVLSIGIGGGLGFFMAANAWGVIWRNNKKLIDGAPANAAELMRQSFLVSRTNFYLSFPMLFFMAASSHYPIFGK